MNIPTDVLQADVTSPMKPNIMISRSIFVASLAYSCLVFTGGFACGMIRIPFLQPVIGPRYAELLEMPIMVVVIWKAATFVVVQYGRKISPSNFWSPSDELSRSLAVGTLGLTWFLSLELLFCAAMGGTTRVKSFFLERDPITGPIFFLVLGLMSIAPGCVL
jgi:hypothetical protein